MAASLQGYQRAAGALGVIKYEPRGTKLEDRTQNCERARARGTRRAKATGHWRVLPSNGENAPARSRGRSGCCPHGQGHPGSTIPAGHGGCSVRGDGDRPAPAHPRGPSVSREGLPSGATGTNDEFHPLRPRKGACALHEVRSDQDKRCLARCTLKHAGEEMPRGPRIKNKRRARAHAGGPGTKNESGIAAPVRNHTVGTGHGPGLRKAY